jgi:uncharacterized repeat protein (TIGR03803 family)
MNLNRRTYPIAQALLIVAAILSLADNASAEWKEKVLYSFQGGTDGAVPAGGVVFDQQGNLYGATQQGGGTDCSPLADCGTVYQLAPPAKDGDPWTETVLHVFQGKQHNDGEFPSGGVISDALGNIYGTASYGGTGDCVLLGIKGGCGTVFELSPPQTKGGQWTYITLYSFKGGKDGYLPSGDLVFDSKGNLYGATAFGGGKGTACDPYYQYCGTVFELSPPKKKGDKWTEKVLHSFAGGTDGANPNGGLVLDSKGSVYGTTFGGGNESGECGSLGCGTAFELTPPTQGGNSWKEKQVHVFTGGNDGAQPSGGLILDAEESLFGTELGGNASGGGVVFRLTAAGRVWKETVLHWFSNNGPGAPLAGLTIDSLGDLYGTTGPGSQYGTVFRLKTPVSHGADWTLYLLYAFPGVPNGRLPMANLVFDRSGNLYSTTTEGGTGACGNFGCGTVFAVSPK